ncbi:DnaJ domain-containing protein [Paraconexibacter sp.]|uniref:J domain-containing protein n=1 Tax=Paraconexibacter sp. TaxID=2949640 RepID=UPI00356361DC
MDPYAVLGLTPDATDAEVERAYRELAKHLHPDRAPGPQAQARMAMVNSARDTIRAGVAAADGHLVVPGRPAEGPAVPRDGRWLSDRVRRALPPELLRELQAFEDVRLVARASTWQSPQVVLAVTDRRLLWSPLHAFSPRVHALRHADVRSVTQRLRRPLRRRAVLDIRTHGGRKVGFGDLDPDAAALIERNVSDGMA